eukprot:3071864-Prymnesium_polylepis.2
MPVSITIGATLLSPSLRKRRHCAWRRWRTPTRRRRAVSIPSISATDGAPRTWRRAGASPLDEVAAEMEAAEMSAIGTSTGAEAAERCGDCIGSESSAILSFSTEGRLLCATAS